VVAYFEGKTLFEDSAGIGLEVRDIKYLNKSVIKTLAPEFSFKSERTLYFKCEYYRNQKG
jgi:hypothetical protein